MSARFFIFCILPLLASTAPLAVNAAPAPTTTDADFYVATDGNDNWSGTLPAPNDAGTDGPFATVSQARERIRGLKQQQKLTEPITVMLRGGTYYLSEPLVFEARDSGTAECPITYAAFPTEQPILCGGRLIEGWQRADGQQWKAHIPAVENGDWYFRQLFVNGERRQRARIPNDGYLQMEGVIDAENEQAPINRQGFRFQPEDISADWTNLKDMEVVKIFPWCETRLPVQDVDADNHVVTCTGVCSKRERRLFDWGGKRYYLENIHEGLDAAGEWYLNRDTGDLYYWPPADENLADTEVIAPVRQQLLRIEGDVEKDAFVEHLQFRGLQFSHSGYDLPEEGYPEQQADVFVPGAIVARGARNCTLANCTIAHVGTYGIELAEGCQDNKIVNSRIFDLGAGAVKIGETDNPGSDAKEACRNLVSDNDIHHGGRVYLGAAGVWVGRCSGNVIAHNAIHQFNNFAVSVGWNWSHGDDRCHHNIVRANHVHDIGQNVFTEISGIYTLGVQRGTEIDGNLVHDINTYRGRGYGGGLSLDQGSSYMLVTNNIVYNTQSTCLGLHYGRENILRNNVFGPGPGARLQRGRQEEHTSITIERNIICASKGSILDGKWEKNFIMDYNLYWVPDDTELQFFDKNLQQWQKTNHDIHSIVADPQFVAADEHDFRLSGESRAFPLGLRPVAPQRAGPRHNQ